MRTAIPARLMLALAAALAVLVTAIVLLVHGRSSHDGGQGGDPGARQTASQAGGPGTGGGSAGSGPAAQYYDPRPAPEGGSSVRPAAGMLPRVDPAALPVSTPEQVARRYAMSLCQYAPAQDYLDPARGVQAITTPSAFAQLMPATAGVAALAQQRWSDIVAGPRQSATCRVDGVDDLERSHGEGDPTGAQLRVIATRTAQAGNGPVVLDEPRYSLWLRQEGGVWRVYLEQAAS